jgi:hypothetical protein
MGWKEVAVTAMLLSSPVGHGGGGLTPSDWREIAAAGQAYDEQARDAASKAVESLAKAARQRAREALSAMAGAPPGAEGIQAAHDTLVASLSGLEAPDADFSGEGPNVKVLKRAGVMVLHGLVAREARRLARSEKPDAEAAALLRTIEGLKGLHAVARNQLKEEARQGLGDALYVRALPPEGSTQDRRSP